MNRHSLPPSLPPSLANQHHPKSITPPQTQPTIPQSFFTEDLGMPVTMTPDFDTLSCTMTFGQRPPPLLEQDPVLAEPCYKECPSARMAMAAKVCPKLTALAQSSSSSSSSSARGGGGE
jgi:hypothetical protein